MHPFLNIAVKAARRAGNIIVRALDRSDSVEVTKKAKNDFVTSVDRAAEADIIETIQRNYPKHNILGEETGSIAGRGDVNEKEEVTWIIDPLDGTMNFIHGFPHFCISIGIQIQGVIEHGLVYDPIGEDLFTASKGQGAQQNGRRIRTSQCSDIQEAMLATGFAIKRTNQSLEKTFSIFKDLLERSTDIRRTGSAALDLAYVAAGFLDGFWESNLKPWDMAAGSLLVREAGGYVSDFQGKGEYLANGQIIAASRKIYPVLLETLER